MISTSTPTSTGSKSRWGKVRGVKKLFGKKKKQDDESVASATSLDSAATPDTLSREIAEMTKDIASTPLTKEKKKEKRGWFSSGKKNPKKKVRTCEEIIIYVASQQLTQPSIRFTHSRRRPKAKKRGQKRSPR